MLKNAQGGFHDLYWTVGDGGPQGDPDNKAQDRSLFHGSVVRISVPSAADGKGYEIPTGNAIDGADGALSFICCMGEMDAVSFVKMRVERHRMLLGS